MNKQLLEPSPVHREVYYWLKDRIPEAERTTLVHADPRPGNWLFQGDKVVVMLDWEMVHLGDPTEDLGWVTQFVYAREHFAAGFWEEEDFLRYYEEKTGFKVRPANLEWYKVFATWKIWAIALTGVKSFCEGKSDRAAAPPKAMEWILANMIGL
jgi:aminoglycoside phosphotransferase (APT) family kinase protein